MREGPLAALFRRTEEEGLDGLGAGATAEPSPAAEPQPATPAAREIAPQPQAAAPAPAQPSAPAPSAPAFQEPALPPTPSPQERLRHAFSNDIPDNMMDPPSAAASAPASAPHDVYARVEEQGLPSGAYGTGRSSGPVLRVVGVGGGGVNAVNRMVEAEVTGVEFLAVNTDLQSLQQSAAHLTLHIGADVTRGLGSGS
ncbi:MAG TPA: hypothetical protein VLK58_28500, partial [Conexibacter sp.]|nr:hypothetical protein [Conexibacter sp.]